MSAAHVAWLLTGSTLNPIILVLRLANSGCSPAMYPSSVVQTGVKSLGCENRIAQPSPIHSWKLIVPCVVSAVKSGATSLIRGTVFVTGGTVAVLMVVLLEKLDRPAIAGVVFRIPQRFSNAGKTRSKKRNPPDLRRVGVESLLRYPHPGVRVQQHWTASVERLFIVFRIPAGGDPVKPCGRCSAARKAGPSTSLAYAPLLC